MSFFDPLLTASWSSIASRMILAGGLSVSAACASGETPPATSPEDTGVDSSDPGDSSTPGDTAPLDATDAGDSLTPKDAGDATPETPVDAPKDVITSDVPTRDAGTFPCGASRCQPSLEICRRATGPGTCPVADSGTCPEGCPGCPPLSTKCEGFPAECFAFPSCSCLLVALCKGADPSKGTCVEDPSGAFTVGCTGV